MKEMGSTPKLVETRQLWYNHPRVMKMVKGFESMLAGSLDLEEPWYITGAEFNPVKNVIDVYVGIREDAVIACPHCGGPTKRYGYEPTERSWRHADCLF